eukprot:3196357-Amphidinium_carterae.1
MRAEDEAGGGVEGAEGSEESEGETVSTLDEEGEEDNSHMELFDAVQLDLMRRQILPNKDNREFVLDAVKKMSGLALRYASERLRADREIVLAAVSTCGVMIGVASQDLVGDREIAIAA